MTDLVDLRRTVLLSEVVGQVVPLKRAGRKARARCPFHAERTPSFFVDDARGLWRCYGCGLHGDAIDFVMRAHGLSFRDAVVHLGGRLDFDAIRAREERERRRREMEALDARDCAAREADARDLWAARRPAGSIVERYFASRAVRWPAVPPTIGLLEDFPYWHQADGRRRARVITRLPVMIAAIQNAAGRIVGVHLTHLAPGGNGKARLVCPETGEVLPAKKVRGLVWGGAIRLSPAPGPGLWHGVGEGIESTASCMAGMDFNDMAVAAAREQGAIP